MTTPIKSGLTGAVSGAVTALAAVYSMGATSAIAMPAGWPDPAWNALVVFGAGAALPALPVHGVALLLARPGRFTALAGFCVASSAVSGVMAGDPYPGAAVRRAHGDRAVAHAPCPPTRRACGAPRAGLTRHAP